MYQLPKEIKKIRLCVNDVICLSSCQNVYFLFLLSRMLWIHFNRVQLIDKDYTTSNCKCRIRDVACKVCGNVIGYHITQPCQQCLRAPNNGHFWMFHTDGVVGQERLSMDLKKLVEELVRGPETPAPAGPTVNLSVSATATTAPGVAPDAATTRLTSVSRLQRLQRQQERQANSVEAMLLADTKVELYSTDHPPGS